MFLGVFDMESSWHKRLLDQICWQQAQTTSNTRCFCDANHKETLNMTVFNTTVLFRSVLLLGVERNGSVTVRYKVHKLLRMIELLKISDPVLLQILVDTLDSKNILYRIENAGMNALMPLPTVMDARVLVDEDDQMAAKQIIQDLELE